MTYFIIVNVILDMLVLLMRQTEYFSEILSAKLVLKHQQPTAYPAMTLRS